MMTESLGFSMVSGIIARLSFGATLINTDVIYNFLYVACNSKNKNVNYCRQTLARAIFMEVWKSKGSFSYGKTLASKLLGSHRGWRNCKTFLFYALSSINCQIAA